MVAYSFKAQFEEEIRSGRKLQTVRGPRQRHARPGETVQLYCAMRTKHCRKIVNPDPICRDVRLISIDLSYDAPRIIAAIEIDGVALSEDEITAFAVADGFGCDRPGACPVFRMGRFWLANHNGMTFDGVVVRWCAA